MKRSKHTLSHYRMVTTNMGRLVPIGCVPVLPGDTVQHHTSALVRVSPLNTPVMHPVSVRIHHFFVANRILDPNWETFITGGNDGLGASLLTMNTSNAKKSVLTYLGLPPIPGVEVLAYPVRAFNLIYNEYYRDQDLVPERDPEDVTIPFVAWEKDYFTTARPFTQRGPEVTLPLGQTAPVGYDGDASAGLGAEVWDLNSEQWKQTTTPAQGSPWTMTDVDGTGVGGLKADLANALAPSVNDFRAAFSLQRYQEARARYGARFTEYLRYLGIRPSDARLQRPEFLGGGTARLNFSEVLQTAPTDASGGPEDATGIGDLFGHGIAGMRSNAYRKFFEEHGYIISVMSIRPKALYMNGIHRDWLKRTKEDYFQKELANLGQQEVYQAELYAEPDLDVFGYQDRYQEYRTHPSQVGQDFRDTLNAWHLGRELEEDVTLNKDFVDCNPSRRIFQITDETVDTMWVMANHHMVARRLVPKRANPRIL